MNSKKIQSIYGKVDCESCIACGIPEQEIEAFKEAYTHCPTGAIKRKNSPF